ncbi:helix-turn-helix transcriptional regulator [Flavivirga rizhaonensis]|uniref:Helix-turn-helix domain-containing protein n=1 Tax=Flavivirga rizhaonensis TaxID=2559571 RepID=A0A4S1DXX7_9FLAO|nr:helix-turn-helix transcriptional regulator [Flavivirga rizhaonensis]TGV02813.1 helix-turn-helix domain-containing protein [Flavivirga rizhaonensis]
MKNKIPVKRIKEPKERLFFSDFMGIQSVAKMLNGAPMVEKLHKHDFYFVLVLENGSGSHFIDFISYPVENYTIYFMRPGQVHQLTLEKDCTGFLINFNSEIYLSKDKVKSELLRKASGQNFYQLEKQKFNRLYSTITYLFQEFNNKKKGFEEIVIANLTIFFSELTRFQKRNSLITVSSYSLQRIDEFQQLLETQIYTQKKVSYYTKKMNISQYQLNSITKETLGKTASEMIQEQVILEAKKLLLATTNQVNQIAMKLGYEDVSYFIRLFKKHTYQPPDTFRINFK